METVAKIMTLRQIAEDESIPSNALFWVHQGLRSAARAENIWPLWTPQDGYANIGQFELLPQNAQALINAWSRGEADWPWPHLPGPGRIFDVCTEAKVSLLWYAEQTYYSDGA